MKKILILTMAMTIWQSSSAEFVWSGNKTIAQLEVGQDGGFNVYFNTDLQFPCGNAVGTNGVSVNESIAGVTAYGKKALYAQALAAFLDGRQISAYYDHNSANCSAGVFMMN